MTASKVPTLYDSNCKHQKVGAYPVRNRQLRYFSNGILKSTRNLLRCFSSPLPLALLLESGAFADRVLSLDGDVTGRAEFF